MYFTQDEFLCTLENNSCWQAARKKKISKTKQYQRNWKSTRSQKKRKQETSSSHTLRIRFLEFPPRLAAWHILIEQSVANGAPNTMTFVWVAPSTKQQPASFLLHVVTIVYWSLRKQDKERYSKLVRATCDDFTTDVHTFSSTNTVK